MKLYAIEGVGWRGSAWQGRRGQETHWDALKDGRKGRELGCPGTQLYEVQSEQKFLRDTPHRTATYQIVPVLNAADSIRCWKVSFGRALLPKVAAFEVCTANEKRL